MGGQSGTLMFFWNQLLTGQHLANSGGGQLKKHPVRTNSFTNEDVMSFKSFRLKNGSLIIEERHIVDNSIRNKKLEEKKIIWWRIFVWKKVINWADFPLKQSKHINGQVIKLPGPLANIDRIFGNRPYPENLFVIMSRNYNYMHLSKISTFLTNAPERYDREMWVTTKERVPLPNQMNFWKNSKRPLTPPPHF